MCLWEVFSLRFTLRQRSLLSFIVGVSGVSLQKSFYGAYETRVVRQIWMRHLLCSIAMTLANNSARGLVCACPPWLTLAFRGGPPPKTHRLLNALAMGTAGCGRSHLCIHVASERHLGIAKFTFQQGLVNCRAIWGLWRASSFVFDSCFSN